MKMKIVTLLLAGSMAFMACSSTTGTDAAQSENPMEKKTEQQAAQTAEPREDVLVDIETTAGPITVRLYGDTPAHQDNFLKLVNENFYNGTLFHRVIKDFMIQAGDPESKTAKKGQQLGSGDPGYTLPAELKYPAHFHKRGALAAARTGDQINPQRRSSGSQFYIVTGKKYSEAELDQMLLQPEMQKLIEANRARIQELYSAGDTQGLDALEDTLVEQARKALAANPQLSTIKETYTTVGGAPFLDGQYTVFGEVVSGMETVDAIEKVETDGADRPQEDIKIISVKVHK
ncbi:MAG: peptidylprolyl isomerase [Muribaculaceae bacterium]|nr:peptidylprolyl isomerase [Muribaculaceae bacterium]